MSVLLAPTHEDLINIRWADARGLLGDREVFVRLLAPPHACAGTGELRVVRATALENGVEVVLTYADFVRV